MKTFTSYILCALFSLLAASQAWAQDIVGAWTRGDTTKKGSAVIVFLADGRFYNFEIARAEDTPTGIDGVEWGTYTWNPATGALTVNLSQDGNGDIGVGRLSLSLPPSPHRAIPARSPFPGSAQTLSRA